MRIAMGSDHAGFGLKEQIKRFVQDQGHEVRDYGTHDSAPVDYPDFAEKVGLALRKGGGGPRHPDLRQRCRRFRGRQQAPRHSSRRLPRYLFGPPGRGAR